jgi:alanyl-tRNA synthetase
MDAVQHALKRDAQVRAIASELRVAPDEVNERVDKLLDEKRQLNQDLSAARLEWRKAEASAAIRDARRVGDFKVAAVRLDGVAGKDVRPLAESLRDQLGSGVVLVAATDEGKVSLVVAKTATVPDSFKSGVLIGQLAPIVGGRGGGKPDVAQAGGSDLSRLDELISTFYQQAEAALSA